MDQRQRDDSGQVDGFHVRRVALRKPEVLEAAFARLGLGFQRLSHREGENWTASAQLGSLGFQATSTFGSGRAWGAVPAGSMIMQLDMGSEGPRRISGRMLGADDIGVAFGGTEFDIVTAERHRAVLFSLPQAAVVNAMAHRAPATEGRLGAQLVLTGCAAESAKIRRLASAAFGSTDRPLRLPTSGHAYGEFVDALIGALLLPWEQQATARLETAHYHRLPIVRRVEAFMRSNLGEPLMLRDLCSAARASERAVEYAFRDVYGVGAKQYLKLLRLNQVRRDLIAVPPEAASIADIAGSYGFWHMGHFSTAYRRLFGETPGQRRSYR